MLDYTITQEKKEVAHVVNLNSQCYIELAN